jgi:hypothetical protein
MEMNAVQYSTPAVGQLAELVLKKLTAPTCYKLKHERTGLNLQKVNLEQ